MKILVADDSAAAREAVARVLISAGHRVVFAADGVEAFRMLFAEQPDLLLLDLQMPRITGWMVCRMIKEDPALSRFPVLVLTGLEGAEDRYWAERSGADGVVGKAEMESVLLEQIQAVTVRRALSDLSGDPAPVVILDDDDVLARVCRMLDRKLFEETVVNDLHAIGLRPMDLQDSAEEILAVLRRLVAYDVGAIGLLPGRLLALRAARPLDIVSLTAFRDRALDGLLDVGEAEFGRDDLTVSVRLAPGARFDGPSREWGAWHVAPLRARGRVLGAVILASERTGLFDDRVGRTLHAVTPAIAAVADGAAQHRQSLVRV